MMESRKKLLIFGGIVLFLLIAIIVAFFLTREKKIAVESPTATSTAEVVPSKPPQAIPVVQNTPAPAPTTTEEREKLFVKQLARTFVERFETSSSQNNNRNVVDAAELSTEKMAGYVKSQTTAQSAQYNGVTTNVVSMDVTAFTATDATVKIGAQVITQSATGSNTSYKNGSVQLKKIAGTWKVDGLFWDAT